MKEMKRRDDRRDFKRPARDDRRNEQRQFEAEENENQIEGRNALTEALRSGRNID